MAADPNNAVFFPPTLLFLLEPFSAAARWSHLAWCAALVLLAFAALRAFGLSRGPAGVAAFALAISGPAMTLASLPTTAWAVAGFLPLLALAGSGSTDGRRVVAGGALLVALVILAGEPAIAAEMLALGLLFAVLSSRWTGARLLAASAGLGAAVAAPQIVTAAGLLRDTVRGGGLAVASGAAYHSVRPARLLSIVWPGLFGDVHSAAPDGFWGGAFFDAGTPYISTLAVGTVTWVLLPSALKDPRGRRLLAVAAAAMLLSFGRFLPGGAALLSFPGFSFFRYPEKWLFFALAAAIAAAGVSLDRLGRGDRRVSRVAAYSAGAAASLSLAAAATVALFPAAVFSALRASRIVAPAMAASAPVILGALRRECLVTGTFAALGALALLGFRKRPARLFLALAALIVIDLFPRTWSSVPLESTAAFDSSPPAVSAALAIPGRFSFGEETEVAPDPLRPMRPSIWGVSFSGNNDIDRFSPRRSFFFSRALASLPFSDGRKGSWLRLAGVGAVSTIDPSAAGLLAPLFRTSPIRVVYRLDGGERFRVVSNALRAASSDEARTLTFGTVVDLKSALVIEEAVPRDGPGGRSSVRPVARRGDRESVVVFAERGGYLFRSETFDPHWRVSIDGAPARVLPADYAFQAVAVPPGTHRVEFSYVDRALVAAMALSLTALGGVALLLRGRGGPGGKRRLGTASAEPGV